MTVAGPNIVTPVALPPGRLRLATKLSLTGSLFVVNTMAVVKTPG